MTPPEKPLAGSAEGTSHCAERSTVKLVCPVRNMQGKPFLIPCCDSPESWTRLTAKELVGMISAELRSLKKQQTDITALRSKLEQRDSQLA